MDWVYLAGSAKASLVDTLQAVVQNLLLWRPAHNTDGALIPNVGNLHEGDRVFLGWRGDGHAYLRCRVAAPLRPLVHRGRSLVIDRVRGADADGLVAAGYETDVAGDFEVIRLDEVAECYFPLGHYGGNNAIHKLADADRPALAAACGLPTHAFARQAMPGMSTPKRANRPTASSAAVAGPQDLDVRLDGPADARAFDAYLMVDWSSSSTPTTGNDSIWVAAGRWSKAGFVADEPKNLSTRAEAVDYVTERASEWKRAGLRVLVGMDFAFGYPAGFANALALPSTKKPWLAVHEHFGQHVTDTDRNAHNRDAFAAACNAVIAPTGPGPFWGCTKSAIGPTLTMHREGVFRFPYAGGLEDLRLTDRRAARRVVTQSVWKLNCGVSVGGQTIVGIKHLHALATALDAKRWPFDTGWAVPQGTEGCIWFAEVFPSLIRYPEWESGYTSERDRTQVQSCVRHAAERDRDGLLSACFQAPPYLSAAELARVTDEEGWILFVDP